jgi:Domain of Unknown Function (DUF1206)
MQGQADQAEKQQVIDGQPRVGGGARGIIRGRPVLYVLIGWIAVQIAVGHSGQQADQTGALHALAYQAWRKEFLNGMQLGQLRARDRRIVTWLGEAGGIARGIVFGAVGVFLVIAAVQARPQQAKGVDSALRALSATPLGPWLLVLVALGLIMFGVFSWCEARWIRL